MTRSRPAAVIVLAAGAGTRMKSATAKVLHRLGGRSLIGHAVSAARSVEPGRLNVVVRHQRDQVATETLAFDAETELVDQDDVPGTGRAVLCALRELDARGEVDGNIVVMASDTPLIDGEVLAALLDAHHEQDNAITVLSAVVDNPHGYGRVLRAGDQVVGVVEEGDATDDQRAIREINSSTYVFDAAVLRQGLAGLSSDNDQGEVYLTDVVADAHSRGKKVNSMVVANPISVEGINDRAQLAVIGRELNNRIVTAWMRHGVTVIDPATTWIDVDVSLAPDVTIHPGTQLHGATTVAEGAVVGPETTLRDVEVGEGASVVRTHAELATIAADAQVGPFAYLRPGSQVGDAARVGTFVELKNSTLGPGAKVPHLTYVGDADIGESANIGASSVFVNYDGVTKRRSTIGAHARTGADSMFVAPVAVGDGAYTGAGTVVRHDVPPGALSVNATSQRIIERWVLDRRGDTGSADAARKALGESSDGDASTPDDKKGRSSP